MQQVALQPKGPPTLHVQQHGCETASTAREVSFLKAFSNPPAMVAIQNADMWVYFGATQL